MTTRISFLCGIISLLIIIFSDYKIPFAIVGIIALIVSWISHGINASKTNNKKEIINRKKTKTINAVVTDDNTALAIKSISEEQNGFKTIQDIVRETNLPLKIINKAVDWLYMSDFISEEKGRNGKVFVLTPEGRKTFTQIIVR
jgi:predicted transcriptional regulator